MGRSLCPPFPSPVERSGRSGLYDEARVQAWMRGRSLVLPVQFLERRDHYPSAYTSCDLRKCHSFVREISVSQFFFTTSRVCLKGKTQKTPRVRNDWVDETQSRRPTTNRWTGRITHSTSHAHEQLSILQFPFARWQFGTTNQRWKERYTRLIIRRFAFLHHGIWDCRPTRWLIYISTS